MRKMFDAEHSVPDAKFDERVAQLFKERASAFEASARSEREGAAMGPEELALKCPNRR